MRVPAPIHPGWLLTQKVRGTLSFHTPLAASLVASDRSYVRHQARTHARTCKMLVANLESQKKEQGSLLGSVPLWLWASNRDSSAWAARER
jgi:hypothetical protein